MRPRTLSFFACSLALGVLALLPRGVGADDTTVDIRGFAFNPAPVTVTAGASVTWRNGDGVTHTATGAAFDTGRLAGGQSGTITFATPGAFTYACAIHASMRGTITVVAAAPSPPPPPPLTDRPAPPDGPPPPPADTQPPAGDQPPADAAPPPADEAPPADEGGPDQ